MNREPELGPAVSKYPTTKNARAAQKNNVPSEAYIQKLRVLVAEADELGQQFDSLAAPDTWIRPKPGLKAFTKMVQDSQNAVSAWRSLGAVLGKKNKLFLEEARPAGYTGTINLGNNRISQGSLNIRTLGVGLGAGAAGLALGGLAGSRRSRTLRSTAVEHPSRTKRLKRRSSLPKKRV